MFTQFSWYNKSTHRLIALYSSYSDDDLSLSSPNHLARSLKGLCHWAFSKRLFLDNRRQSIIIQYRWYSWRLAATQARKEFWYCLRPVQEYMILQILQLRQIMLVGVAWPVNTLCSVQRVLEVWAEGVYLLRIPTRSNMRVAVMQGNSYHTSSNWQKTTLRHNRYLVVKKERKQETQCAPSSLWYCILCLFISFSAVRCRKCRFADLIMSYDVHRNVCGLESFTCFLYSVGQSYVVWFFHLLPPAGLCKMDLIHMFH